MSLATRALGAALWVAGLAVAAYWASWRLVEKFEDAIGSVVH